MIVAIRHVPFEDLGYIGAALSSAGLQFQYYDAWSSKTLPNPEDLEGLILMGGPMSANDRLDYLTAELKLLDEAIPAGVPVLGVCLGAQLIAKALGARVFANPVKEIGWAPIYWTAKAASDPLLAGISSPRTVFHWHGETFELPRGADWLAWSDACRHQAFRYGSNVYGLQFHAEVTPAMIADWLQQDANCGDVREIQTPVDPEAHSVEQQELANLLFGRWVETLRGG